MNRRYDFDWLRVFGAATTYGHKVALFFRRLNAQRHTPPSGTR